MADEQIDSLRESARHRGLTLKVSRRRKPGGDFGRMGLVDADGAVVMGVGDDGLNASAEEVGNYLRALGRFDWTTSAGTVQRKEPPAPAPEIVEEEAPAPADEKGKLEEAVAAPQPVGLDVEEPAVAPPPPKAPRKPKSKAAPKPKPKPRFKVDVGNLFAKLPAATRAEAFTTLLDAGTVRVERIVSRGQVTPDDEPMIQASREWVVLLAGEARLRIEDSQEVTLKPGDHLTIAAGQPHWVTYTSRDEAAVWLAVHVDEDRG